jgi:diguanylate cyclase (GGDEF)-like protein
VREDRSALPPTGLAHGPTGLTTPSSALQADPEPGFDDLVALAAHLCGTPMAGVSLMSEGVQWFKAHLGFEPITVPVERSFCAHTIAARRVFTVPDAAADPRFADSPLVRVCGMRFYTGAPLLTTSGEAVGALAVFDTVPRTLGAAELGGLGSLAGQAMAQVELRQKVADLDAALHQLERANEAIRQHALCDPLTGLPNRGVFEDQLGRATARLERQPGAVGVVFADVDGFKFVNDTLGHLAGDRLLVQLGQRIAAALRPTDMLARLGGDEFAILVTDLDAPEDVVAVAERVRAAVSAPFTLDGRPVRARLSVGVTTVHSPGVPPETLLRQAEAAMYRAKARGRDRVEVYTAEVGTRTARRLDVESALHEALQREEFRLHYQPIVNLRTGRVTAFEALLRWQRAEHGLVPPDEFIPIAEETGLIIPIGRWVAQHACHQLATWLPVLPAGRTLSVTINLSPREFAQPDVVATLQAAADAASISATQVCVEITESALMDDSDTVVDRLVAIRQAGFQLAIDDFGAGYSSLRYVKLFPIDIIKVDRAFTAGLPDDAGDTAIVGAVMALAASLNLTAVAEGVESPAQLAALRHAGYTRAQGYLFARPLPAEAAIDILHDEPLLPPSHLDLTAEPTGPDDSGATDADAHPPTPGDADRRSRP